jgi:hypothetical protein
MAEFEYEMLEWESEAEAAERAPMRRPSSAPSYKPRPAPGTPNAVTQAQLEAALARVDGKIKTVVTSVSTIHSRLNSIAASSKKEAEERKKGLEGQGKDINQKLQLLALLPLLIQTPSTTLNAATPLKDSAGNPINTISVPDTNTMDSILPLLLVSGLGSYSGGGGGLGLGDGSGSDSSMMLLALVLAFSGKK